ncbi:helix-turn-helix domain-containing protein [Streptomyces litchfieldiae]|uniref:Helix-turn-helix domain-containing protein n=1 Tax=Streptomyces litchfieldiae TaxID=3075543 RepID=A0ABU2MW09_9ACTN|nr:helix-turn-helix domain-containing protein [Streptomyces sp. DSM 44938]MDT0345821.1 helix-turn-helix domain-containing protein [Streptomyces sp. DSM 44938]
MALHIDERLRQLDSRKNASAALMDTVRDLGEQRSFDALLTTIARRARLLLHADVTLVSLCDDQGVAAVRASDGAISAVPADLLLPGGAGPGAEATRSRAAVWTSDYFADERFPRAAPLDDLVRAEGLSSLLAVPLRGMDGIVGVLYAGQRDVRSYTADEVAMMTALADYASSSLEQSRALEEARARVAYTTVAYDRLRAQMQAEQQATNAGHRMVDFVLGGADAQALAAETAGVLGGAVAIRDENDLTIAQCGEIPDDCNELDKAILEARAERAVVTVGEDITVVPVRAGSEDLGALILRCRQSFAEADRTVLHHVARATAVLALLSRNSVSTDAQVRDETLEELLNASPRERYRTAQWTQRLGLDLGQPHVIVVAQADGGQRARTLAWAARYVSRCGGAKTMREGALVLLLPGADPKAAATEVTRQLGQMLGRPVTSGGASAWGEQHAVSRGYQQALRCLEALTSLGQHGTAATVDELGFVGMLLGGNRNVGGFIEATLGPVILYDAERSTDLGNTLEAYFAAGGSPTHAAEALQVHPNTVARRLERISQLLGPDWQEAGRALEIQLALRLQRIRSSLHDSLPPVRHGKG